MLTPKQKLFVDYFLKTRNATESVRLAGYSSRYANRQGSRLLNDVVVRQRIDELERAETEFACTKTEYLRECREKIDNAEEESVRARYFELLGKVLGYVKNTPDVTQNVSILSVDELSKLHNSRNTNNLQQRDTIPVDKSIPVQLNSEVDRSQPIPVQDSQSDHSSSDNVT